MTPGEIDDCFPSDHSDQIEAWDYITRYAGRNDAATTRFLDLGAGPGGSHDRAAKAIPGLRWTGLDIEDSPPVRNRKRTDLDFRTYDGVHMPFGDATFDFVFCRQVFEHVRHPDALLAEIFRVIRPGGIFAGSVSQLEPFHSYSYGCFTYYGFAALAADAGLRLAEFRPGVDGLTLIARSFLKYQLKANVDVFDDFVKNESPLNIYISHRLKGKSHREINKEKVRYTGHLCFKFIKPAD